MSTTPMSELERFISNLPSLHHELDIIMLVDGSSSISSGDFTLLGYTLRSICSRLPLGDSGSCYVGVIQYAGAVQVVSELTRDQNKLFSRITGMVQLKHGATHTDKGIEAAVASLKTARQGSHKVVFLVTDGQSNGAEKPELTAARSRDAVEVVCVGIGRSVDEGELRRVAHNPQMAFFVASVEELNKMFSTSKLVPSTKLELKVLERRATSLRLQALNDAVQELSVDIYVSSRLLRPTETFKGLRPSAPEFDLENLPEFTNIDVRASALLTNGLRTSTSAIVSATTLKACPEAALRASRELLVKAVASLKSSLEKLARRVNVLIVGPGDAGKSTLIDGFKTVYTGRFSIVRPVRGAGTLAAASGAAPAQTSSVSQDLFKLTEANMCLWDIWGWTTATQYTKDFVTALCRGVLKEGFRATDSLNVGQDPKKFNTNPSITDGVHAVVIVFPVTSLSNHSELQSLIDLYRIFQELDLQPLVLLSKVDRCDAQRISVDPLLAYESDVVQDAIENFHKLTGISRGMILPHMNILEKEQENSLALHYMLLKALDLVTSWAVDFLNRKSPALPTAPTEATTTGVRKATSSASLDDSSADDSSVESPARTSARTAASLATKEITLKWRTNERKVTALARTTAAELLQQFRPRTCAADVELALYDERNNEVIASAQLEDLLGSCFEIRPKEQW